MPEHDERLIYLFQQYTANACTREEMEELSGRISAEGEEHIHHLMDAWYRGLQPGAGAERIDWELMFSRIVSEPVAVPVRRLRIGRWVAAAILILLAGIGSYYLLRTKASVKENEQEVAAVKDIAPGKYKAMLTLVNGQQIVLDSAGTGKLAQQGAASIINRSGRLIYADDHSHSNEVIYNTLSTARGETYAFVLADGTKVWLDAATSIRFPAVFRGADRTVEIIAGQAYFEVAPNAKKPFFVRQDKVNIQVLGTHFNVSAYKEEGTSKVTLLEGSIRVSSGDAGHSVLLKPGQQARIDGESVQVTTGVDEDQVMAWKNGLFNFKNTDLKIVMQEISRWYAIDIGYEGKAPNIVMTGKAPRSLSLKTMLQLLELSEVKYRIEGRRLVIEK